MDPRRWIPGSGTSELGLDTMRREDWVEQDQYPEAGTEVDDEVFGAVLRNAPAPILLVRADGTIALANRALGELLDYDPSDLLGKPMEALLPAGLRSLHEEHRARYLKEPEARPMGEDRDLLIRTRTGSVIPVEIGLSPVQGPSGLLVVCSVVDLSIRSRLKAELLEAAASLRKANRRLSETVSTDGLTSLRNRQAFMDHLSVQLESSSRHGRPLSVLILDIDYFKAYNDAFGHLAGDDVLKRLGKVFRDASRRSDLVARLGGEEFGVILPETDESGAITFGDRFRKAVERVQWPLREVTVSVGATTVDPEGPLPRPEPPEISRVLTEADQALYRSKALGRNRLTHFSGLDEDWARQKA